MLGRFLILGQYLTISGKRKKLVISLYLLIHDLSTTSRNNIQHNAKIKIVAIIIALLFPNSKILLYQTFSYDFPKIRNLPKIFLRSSENVAPGPRNVDTLCNMLFPGSLANTETALKAAANEHSTENSSQYRLCLTKHPTRITGVFEGKEYQTETTFSCPWQQDAGNKQLPLTSSHKHVSIIRLIFKVDLAQLLSTRTVV